MFGGKKIKIDKEMYERVEQLAELAGYSSVDEFVLHVLEKEMAQFEDAVSDDDIKEKLKGLGYLG
jgi:predicted DNA-binding protein